MESLVLPGQPLSTQSMSAALLAGESTFSRNGSIFSSIVGRANREGATLSVHGKADAEAIPEPNSIVIGTITRVTRAAATVAILTVDGRPCRPDFSGLIRVQDIRQTAKEVKVFDCFRPGDVVCSKVLSLGDSRSYFLSTAANSLGVLFAVSATTGNALQAESWESMIDPEGGDGRESRKVAGPE